MTLKISPAEAAALRRARKHARATLRLSKLLEGSGLTRQMLCQILAGEALGHSNYEEAEARDQIFRLLRIADAAVSNETIEVEREPAPEDWPPPTIEPFDPNKGKN